MFSCTRWHSHYPPSFQGGGLHELFAKIPSGGTQWRKHSGPKVSTSALRRRRCASALLQHKATICNFEFSRLGLLPICSTYVTKDIFYAIYAIRLDGVPQQVHEWCPLNSCSIYTERTKGPVLQSPKIHIVNIAKLQTYCLFWAFRLDKSVSQKCKVNATRPHTQDRL
jgi:hypothetical protein